MSPVKRICVFEHSVMTNFNCACPAIQRGQGSGLLSEGSSWLTACMSEQQNSKKLGHPKNCRNNPKIWTLWLYHRVMCPKDLEGMANSVNPDQTAGSTLFAQACVKTWDHYGNFSFEVWLLSQNQFFNCMFEFAGGWGAIWSVTRFFLKFPIKIK